MGLWCAMGTYILVWEINCNMPAVFWKNQHDMSLSNAMDHLFVISLLLLIAATNHNGGCTFYLKVASGRGMHSYDVTGIYWVIQDLWAGTRENYIKFKCVVDGLPMGWCWISASTNADTCDQKPSGGQHIGDHTRKWSQIQVALSELRLNVTCASNGAHPVCAGWPGVWHCAKRAVVVIAKVALGLL